jgi:two-component system chemotaxis response regulator CheB
VLSDSSSGANGGSVVDRAATHGGRVNVTTPAAELRVVVIAASAGGLGPIGEVLAALPADFPAAVIVLQHMDASHRSALVEILARKSALPVVSAAPGALLRGGKVFVSPPGDHVVVRRAGTLGTLHTPPVNFVRPAADVLLRSVAEMYGERAIAVVLSGMGVDGAAGAAEVKRLGGVVVVQDEVSASFFGMPGATIGTGVADAVLAPAEIAALLTRLVEAA